MTDLLIFPFGGNAREALTAVLAQNSLQPRWNILGFLDDDERHWGVSFCDYSVLGGKQLISEYPESEILAVPGNPENYRSRESVITSLGLPADRFATILDPSVMVAPNVEIGYNTLVLANVFLSVSTKIGNHCVILPNTVISHDSQIGDGTLIGANVSISGGCKVDRNCYIGSGSRLRESIRIGQQSMVGLGANVVKNVPEKVVVVGNPARVLKSLD